MASCRYWRIYVVAAAGGHGSMAEVELRTSQGGADETGSGTAICSSYYSGMTAAMAVDNNINTAWANATPTPPLWWGYDFGEGVTKDIVEIAITARNDAYYNQAPSVFYVQFSDDGSNWTSLWYVETSWSSAGQQKVFTKPSSDCRYWKLSVTGVAEEYTSLSEIELRASVGGADETGSGTASASSEYPGGYVASNAVDNNTATDWIANGVVPQWWKYDFGAGVTKAIVEIAITPSSRESGRWKTQCPAQFYVLCSSDQVSWLIGGNFATSWPNTNQQSFQLFPTHLKVSQFVGQVETTEGDRLNISQVVGQIEGTEGDQLKVFQAQGQVEVSLPPESPPFIFVPQVVGQVETTEGDRLSISQVIGQIEVTVPSETIPFLFVSQVLGQVEVVVGEALVGPTMEQLMRHGTYFKDGVKKPMWWAK